MAPDDQALAGLARQMGEVLSGRHLLLATAESCTGGWIAKVITDVPGSSRWFERGFVTYTHASKQDMLGVSAATLSGHGAVSEATAREMALGALAHGRAQVTLAVTGIAGPGGGSPEKPVGTVWFAWAGEGLPVRSESRVFAGDREAVRRQAVVMALQGVIRLTGAC